VVNVLSYVMIFNPYMLASISMKGLTPRFARVFWIAFLSHPSGNYKDGRSIDCLQMLQPWLELPGWASCDWANQD
jgi:hypothetical protein